MKIIFSRKGFDTSSGGCPSPILPDGTLVSLPIPDSRSTIRYKDINRADLNLGQVVSVLTSKRLKGTDRAHMDPDIDPAGYPRRDCWLPIFGQKGAAQGHLRNQGVGPGDLFLFYGLFRQIEKQGRTYWWRSSAPPQHVFWGWLQVEQVLEVTPALAEEFDWISYHPHFSHPEDKNNVIYLSRKYLQLPGREENLRPGSGLFDRVTPSLLLTDQNQNNGASVWELPGWCYPRNGVYPLSYHNRMDRWKRTDSKIRLKSVPRGQEFVLDTRHYPEALGWVDGLLNSGG